ncbi:MAG: hypothetical protein BWZ10_02470 [candidate division BRC1 bacterium ADurb.BinA364]|nr:MAG: hypothetical protein BWZ10_02470 [candidate division BRC1 bacterium ADurb.BinA364]
MKRHLVSRPGHADAIAPIEHIQPLRPLQEVISIIEFVRQHGAGPNPLAAEQRGDPVEGGQAQRQRDEKKRMIQAPALPPFERGEKSACHGGGDQSGDRMGGDQCRMGRRSQRGQGRRPAPRAPCAARQRHGQQMQGCEFGERAAHVKIALLVRQKGPRERRQRGGGASVKNPAKPKHACASQQLKRRQRQLPGCRQSESDSIEQRRNAIKARPIIGEQRIAEAAVERRAPSAKPFAVAHGKIQGRQPDGAGMRVLRSPIGLQNEYPQGKQRRQQRQGQRRGVAPPIQGRRRAAHGAEKPRNRTESAVPAANQSPPPRAPFVGS